MEILRLDLLLYFTLLSAISSSLPYVLKPFWKMTSTVPSEEAALKKEIRSLKKEQNKLSMHDNFAAYSRLQRKINNAEDRLKSLKSDRITLDLNFKSVIHIILNAVLAVIAISSTLAYWSEPLVIIDHKLFPFGGILNCPTYHSNAIVPHAWVVISRVSIATIFASIQTVYQHYYDEYFDY